MLEETEIARLENSIAHLERSNQELRDAVREEQAGTDVDEDAVREFEAAIKENEETMCVHSVVISFLGGVERAGADDASLLPSQTALPSKNASP